MTMLSEPRSMHDLNQICRDDAQRALSLIARSAARRD